MVAATDKRQRILDAARVLILRNGRRGTSMEAIAAAAEIAKPTLYAYFRDKDAVFEGLVAELIAAIRAEFDAALSGDGDVVARIGAALTAKHKVVAKLLAGSPHADALYGEHDRTAAPQMAALEADIAAAVEGELVRAGIARARSLTQVLLAASYGIGCKAKSVPELGPAIRLLVERLVGPELR